MWIAGERTRRARLMRQRKRLPASASMTAGGSGSIAGYGEQGADNHDEVRANILAEVQAATVTLHAGEALFLPAGWAHQVTSVAGGDGLHAAVNTWFGAPTDDH